MPAGLGSQTRGRNRSETGQKRVRNGSNSCFRFFGFRFSFFGFQVLLAYCLLGFRTSAFGFRLSASEAVLLLLSPQRSSAFGLRFRFSVLESNHAPDSPDHVSLSVANRSTLFAFWLSSSPAGPTFFFPFANSALRGPAVCWCCIWTSVFPRVKGIWGCARVSANKVSDILCISGVTEISESAGSNVAETS